MKSFGLSCEDAQDKDDWRLRIKGQLANPGLPGKWPLKCHLYVYGYSFSGGSCNSSIVSM